MSERKGLNRKLFWLYEGHGRVPYFFRLGLLIFDILTIAYFLWAPFRGGGVSHPAADYMIGVVIAIDLAARFYIAQPRSSSGGGSTIGRIWLSLFLCWRRCSRRISLS